MKATDLMVGNKALFHGELITVTGWDISEQAKRDVKGSDSLKGVPITEEILPILGLFPRASDSLNGFYSLKLNRSFVTFRFFNGKLILQCPHNVQSFEFVHQLQNWYKSVTFENLIIEL